MSDAVEKRTHFADSDEKGQNSQFDPEFNKRVALIHTPAEKKLVQKLDARILPITCILYLFACEL
jgi:hypothetical protein